MKAILHRFAILFAVTTLLLWGGASLLYAQTPTPTPPPETPEDRHVGLWLADWQRVPITLPNGGTLAEIVDWSADGERLLLSIYYTNSYTNGEFLTFFAPATGEMRPITAGFPPPGVVIPTPAWDRKHQTIVYLQYRQRLANGSAFTDLAEVAAIDEAGNLLRTFTPMLLTFRQRADELIDKGYTELAGYPANDEVTINRNGRVSVLESDGFVTMRMGESDQAIGFPVTVTQRMSALSPTEHKALWVAPNAEYYALAITRTLSIYRTGEDTPLHEFFSTCGGELAYNSYAQHFEWAPDSEAFYFQFVSFDTLERLCHTYVQRLYDSELRHLTKYQMLSSIPGGSSWPSGITWQANGPWIVIDRYPERQCGGRPPFGCVLSQTLLDRYGVQTPIVWWSINTERDDPILLGGSSAWSPITRKFATRCTRNLWRAQIDNSESAICFFDFSWEKPAVDPCQRPLAENLYCGDPDAFLP